MAKQTFTVGQVLTAAQMTSLQQTAMGGGSTTAKTASYTLVAADAGTVVQMNSASATTITVNQSLFAAGDSVQIQNVGSGVCTVTAGTATVSTSATLALKQYDAGTLYFNTTSAAIFFASDAADGSSPLTTKGDLFTFTTVDARIGVGANNTVLTADSAEASGLKWATPSSGLAAATQAEMETASSTSVATTPGRQQFHPSAAKFWLKFNGTGTPAINASYNITSITDGGTGYYTINIATDFSSGNYAILSTVQKLSGASSDTTLMSASTVPTQNAGDFGLITSNFAGTLSDSDAVYCSGFGDQ